MPEGALERCLALDFCRTALGFQPRYPAWTAINVKLLGLQDGAAAELQCDG